MKHLVLHMSGGGGGRGEGESMLCNMGWEGE